MFRLKEDWTRIFQHSSLWQMENTEPRERPYSVFAISVNGRDLNVPSTALALGLG